jgi:hypothetical protein
VTTNVRRNILINQKNTAEKTNKTRVSAENIKMNDLVWLTTKNSQTNGPHKFLARYFGPFKVLNKPTESTVKLDLGIINNKNKVYLTHGI